MAETFQSALELSWCATEPTYMDPWEGAQESPTTSRVHSSASGALGPLCFLTCVISLEVMPKSKHKDLTQQNRRKFKIRDAVSSVCLVLIQQNR